MNKAIVDVVHTRTTSRVYTAAELSLLILEALAKEVGAGEKAFAHSKFKIDFEQFAEGTGASVVIVEDLAPKIADAPPAVVS